MNKLIILLSIVVSFHLQAKEKQYSIIGTVKEINKEGMIISNVYIKQNNQDNTKWKYYNQNIFVELPEEINEARVGESYFNLDVSPRKKYIYNKKTIYAIKSNKIQSFQNEDCLKVGVYTKDIIKQSPWNFLKIVETQIRKNKNCVGEIVKSAIQAIDANNKQVADIVTIAIILVPSKKRLIAQIAVAAAPDSLGEVQNILAKYDPNH